MVLNSFKVILRNFVMCMVFGHSLQRHMLHTPMYLLSVVCVWSKSGKSILEVSAFPLGFWSHACVHATVVDNLLPHKIKNETIYSWVALHSRSDTDSSSSWTQLYPEKLIIRRLAEHVTLLKVVGLSGYVVNEAAIVDKQRPRSYPGIYLGIHDNTKKISVYLLGNGVNRIHGIRRIFDLCGGIPSNLWGFWHRY